MIDARNIQIMVFVVKILSLRKTQVKTAKTILPTPKPISFEVQSCPEFSTTFLIAYQKQKPIGIAKIKFDIRGLSFHQSHTNCELNWNQARIFATTKKNIPVAMLM